MSVTDSNNIKHYHVVNTSLGQGNMRKSIQEQDSLVQGFSRTPVSTTRNVVSTSQQTSDAYNAPRVVTNVQQYRPGNVFPNSAVYPHNPNTSIPVYTGNQPYPTNYNTSTMREYNPQLDKDARVVSENVIEVASGLPARIVREEPVEFVKEIVREIPREYIQRTVFQEPVTYIREVTYDEPVLVMEQVVEREPYAYYKRTVENVQGGQRVLSSGGTTLPYPTTQANMQPYPGITSPQGTYPPYQSSTQMIPAANYVPGAPRILPMNEVNSRSAVPSGVLQVSQPPPALVASRSMMAQQSYIAGSSRLNSSRG